MESQTKDNQRFLNAIYHEQQSGALCAVHAVNSVFQKRMFNEFQFADIAKGLDDVEHSVLEEGERGKGSVNYDDSGFFSIQVVVRALEIGGISLSHLLKPEMKEVRKNPVTQTAFICNHNKHWFAIRRFGIGHQSRWFNLNSTFKFPEFLSDTFLSLFLEQLITEGYAVFVCRGIYPTCPADPLVSLFDHRTYISPRDKFLKKKINYGRISDPREREQLRRAIEMSKEQGDGNKSQQQHGGGGGFDDDLKRALEMSRRDHQGGGGVVESPGGTFIMEDEDAEIKKAIEMSLMENKNNNDEGEEDNNNNNILPPLPPLSSNNEPMEDEEENNEENNDDVDMYDKEKRKSELSEKYGKEIEEGEDVEIVKIRFRSFNSKVYEWNFFPEQTIGELYDFLEFKMLEEEEEEEVLMTTEKIRKELIIVNNFPKVEMIYSEFCEKTLEELNFKGSIMFSVISNS